MVSFKPISTNQLRSKTHEKRIYLEELIESENKHSNKRFLNLILPSESKNIADK